MAEERRLIHAATLLGFKTAYPNWASAIDNPAYYSVAITDDGHIYTHGQVFQIVKVTTGDTNPYGVDFYAGVNSLTVQVAGTTKTVNINGTSPITVTNTDTSTLTLSHATSLTEVKSSIGSYTVPTITLPSISADLYGHITALTSTNVAINIVGQTADTTTSTSKPLLFGGTNNSTTSYNSAVYVTPNTGALHATILYEGSNALSSIYTTITNFNSHKTTYATGSAYGHVKLSDSITDSTSSNTSNIAATPLAIYNALQSAKDYVTTRMSELDSMRFLGTVNGSGIIQSHNTTIYPSGITDGTTNISALTSYHAGDTWKITSSGTISGITPNVESGDMLICVSNYGSAYAASDWTVVQANTDGVVTSANTLSGIIYGTGTRALSSLGFSSGKILSNNGTAPTWVDTTSLYRTIQVEGTSIGTATLNLKGGALTSVTNASGAVTIASTLSPTTSFTLSGSTLSLNVATNTILGGVKSSTLGTSGNTYYVNVASDGTMAVKVPWTDTTYSIATNTTAGLIKPYIYHSSASTGVSATSDTSAIAVLRGTTAGRYYVLETDSAGRGFVNVPWTDTNTTYSAGTGLSLTSTTFSLATAGSTLGGVRYTGAVTDISTYTQSPIIGGLVYYRDTWRNVQALSLSGTSVSSSKTTIGDTTLTFGDEFLWSGSEIRLGWAEVASDGTVTYSI